MAVYEADTNWRYGARVSANDIVAPGTTTDHMPERTTRITDQPTVMGVHEWLEAKFSTQPFEVCSAQRSASSRQQQSPALAETCRFHRRISHDARVAKSVRLVNILGSRIGRGA